MDLGLQGKHAIVTGGSRGIGKAIARELAHEGVDVAIVARNKGDLEATARELAAETNRRDSARAVKEHRFGHGTRRTISAGLHRNYTRSWPRFAIRAAVSVP
jgi:NAD(P)-dependent dehydrogenase (short-subunit alcohol dehydrogenase family)